MLARLALGETSVSELAQPFPMSLPAILKHVDCLARAGLLEARKEGRVRRCRLEAAPLSEAAEWITRYRRFWEERFAALDRYLRESAHKEDIPWPHPTSAPPSRSGSRARSRRLARRFFAPGRTRKR
jgi:DNA-binding transcriptional ArsR family regulator